jgi:LysM repeat protein
MRRLFPIITMLLVVFAAACTLTTEPVVPTELPATIESLLTCDQLVTQALAQTGSACQGMERNSACYGHDQVNASFEGALANPFESAGDRADLLQLRTLNTAPLDETNGVWGIAIIKAQADLAGTLPGQNVTLLFYGDAGITGAAPTMRGVTLRTSVGDLRCSSMPQSGILIQSPAGVRVTLQLNGADIQLGSTIFVTAYANDSLTIATIEGSARITAFGQTQTATSGLQVRMPLGGGDQLQVIGPPLAPVPLDVTRLQNAPLQLLERPVTLPQPATVIPPTATRPAGSQPTLSSGSGSGAGGTLVGCSPRADWAGSVTVQTGDTLFRIASRFNLTVDELSRGNCLVNANVIQVGQVLRVPGISAATSTPSATIRPGITLTPTVLPGGASATFTADKTTLLAAECTMLRWITSGAVQVTLNQQPVTNTGTQTICPLQSSRYQLFLVDANRKQYTYDLTINVIPPLPTDDTTPTVDRTF